MRKQSDHLDRSLLAAYAEDHRALGALLDRVLLTGFRTPRGGGGGESFALFATELRRHMRAENEALFPSLEDHLRQTDVGPTGVMRQEHGDFQRRLDEIAEDLERRMLAEAEQRARALRVLLVDHFRREESVLFLASGRLQNGQERAAALRALAGKDR